MVQNVAQKPTKVLLLEYDDEVVGVPEIKQRLVTTTWTGQNNVKVPKVQVLDKAVRVSLMWHTQKTRKQWKCQRVRPTPRSAAGRRFCRPERSENRGDLARADFRQGDQQYRHLARFTSSGDWEMSSRWFERRCSRGGHVRDF